MGGLREASHEIVQVPFQTDRRRDEANVWGIFDASGPNRPLYALSNDHNDLAILTPGHFLVGSPMLSVPEPNFPESGDLTDRW